jgi:TIR- and PNP-associating SLOG family
MPKSSSFGRRIHIAGSISDDNAVAPAAEVEQARELVRGLVKELMQRGATFVVPVDAEKVRSADGLPICFDWLVWQTLQGSLARRPGDAPGPLAIAVQHHKNEEQIPPSFERLWDNLRNSSLVQIENAAHWNMAGKRMEVQARWGDILIALGGNEGVLFLANLYHDAGKPVVPLNAPICTPDTGARRLFAFGLSSNHAQRLFRATGMGPHAWINRINFRSRTPVAERVAGLVELLEALEPPKAFAVRLLNPDHADYADVQAYFDTVVEPIVEGELGYKLTVIDGRRPLEHARLDQEIFARLHRSSVVIADITGLRPNCFLELGYALGRGLPTMLMAKAGSEHPFDIYTISGLHWTPGGPVDECRRLFREHWNAIRSRPPLVPMETLIP